jgi:hypothetical protein
VRHADRKRRTSDGAVRRDSSRAATGRLARWPCASGAQYAWSSLLRRNKPGCVSHISSDRKPVGEGWGRLTRIRLRRYRPAPAWRDLRRATLAVCERSSRDFSC